jgi:uncharacterized repeat protein (TIGR03803 family)
MRRSALLLRSALFTLVCLGSSVPPSGALADPILTILHTFNGGSDGSAPAGGPIFDRSGALYGATDAGGVSNLGVVFKLTPPATAGGVWTETVLYNFAGIDGANPHDSLVFDTSGALYGTTSGGGDYGLGTVFELTPPAAQGGAWTESVLHSFAGGVDGSPWGSVTLDRSGALYGVTPDGGSDGAGSIFVLTPPATPGGAWSKSVLHTFAYLDGSAPNGGLIFDRSGALYGATLSGGDHNRGTVFQLTPPGIAGGAWTESVLHSFSIAEGWNPTGLVFDRCARSLDEDAERRDCALRPEASERSFGDRGSRALYGTTLYGPGGGGTVFKLTPPATAAGAWTESVLHTFSGGANPDSGVVFDATGALYGATTNAGPGQARCATNQFVGCGMVFKLTPPTAPGGVWTETDLHLFTGYDGKFPGPLTVGRSGALYGAAAIGSSGDDGEVFKLTIGPPFAGTPGNRDCRAQSVAALAAQLDSLRAAAAGLGYPDVRALQEAIKTFCLG